MTKEEYQLAIINKHVNLVNKRKLGIVDTNCDTITNNVMSNFVICKKFENNLTEDNQGTLDYLINLLCHA